MSSDNWENKPNKLLKIISSYQDQLVSSNCSKSIIQSSGGIEYIHPTAGHDLPLDEPIWLIEKLLSSFKN